MKILVTCPPMLGMMDDLMPFFNEKSIQATCADVIQTLSESELIELVPEHDGWIIGDDPATDKVFEAGKKGRLKAAIKWGIGVDNIDFDAANALGIAITNTPGMFGREVADVAMAYIYGLARETYYIDRCVRAGRWPKPRGISLFGKTAALVGFGDIGRNSAKRMLAADMHVIAYDPRFTVAKELAAVEQARWPERLEEADFLVFTCALTTENKHMLNADVLSRSKKGLRVVNVARGPLIDEASLCDALATGQVHSAALDVFEREPLPEGSPLRGHERCIFGSHNGSNTTEAVYKTSRRAIDQLYTFLGIT